MKLSNPTIFIAPVGSSHELADVLDPDGEWELLAPKAPDYPPSVIEREAL